MPANSIYLIIIADHKTHEVANYCVPTSHLSAAEVDKLCVAANYGTTTWVYNTLLPLIHDYEVHYYYHEDIDIAGVYVISGD